MRSKMFLSAFLIVLLMASELGCGKFKPCPVYEHIEKYGRGIDMTGIWDDQRTNNQLRKKNFIPRIRRK